MSASCFLLRTFLRSIATSNTVTVVARTRRTRPLGFVAHSLWRGRGTRRDETRLATHRIAPRARRRERDDLSFFSKRVRYVRNICAISIG